ncbi:mannose-1-phosphate guanylyltransferase/mannose-6-phosphate isomerase [Alphaproteobacteria bacterium]|nr:mannose-1-phosphate guanylyltransferase/mannose-6-phosphate isomerase [Alphaproteobacteria bacterium]
MKAKPVILSGGAGVRLWPLSRKNLAKQFVDLFQNDSSLFLDTINRVSDNLFCSPLIISNISQRYEILKLIKKFKIKTDKIILESIQRNTAPACVFASYFSNDEDILCIMPSDHYIESKESFTKTLDKAIKLASDNFLVTVGAKAKEPNSNYGYIVPEKKKIHNYFKIESFVEKPSEKIASELVKSKSLWNTGIIVVKNNVLKKLFSRFCKNIYTKSVEACKSVKIDNEFLILEKKFLEKIKEISFDYAILEKNFTKLVVPYNGKWSDLGTYDSLYKIKKSYGDIISINSKNNFIYSKDKLLVVSGIDNQVVVNTKNAVLVTKKNSSSLLRDIVKYLEKNNREEAFDDSVISRPWGLFENIKQEKGYKVKKLLILPGEKISLQKHLKRSEHWVVISGLATITKGKTKFLLKSNESTFIKKGEVHRIENNTKKNLVIVEVQTGNYLEEDDIYRFQDKYNR